MRLLFAYEHFLRRGRRIVVSKNGRELLRHNLTGTKVKEFYDDGSEKTPFGIWRRIFIAPNQNSNVRQETKVRGLEQKVREFLKRSLGREWKGYGANIANAFEGVREGFAGVPDGRETVDGRVTSLLEIGFGGADLEGRVLQLAMYLWLSGLDEGYVFMCPIDYRFRDRIVFPKGMREMFEGSREVTIARRSVVEGIEDLSFRYVLRGEWRGDDREGVADKCRLYRIGVNGEQCERLFCGIRRWMDENAEMSPELNDEEWTEVMENDYLENGVGFAYAARKK